MDYDEAKSAVAEPGLLHINREEARSYYIPFAGEDAARAGVKARSPYYRLLSGNWSFAYFERYIDCEEGIEDKAIIRSTSAM